MHIMFDGGAGLKRIWLLFFYTSYLLYALPQAIEDAVMHSGIPREDITIYIKEAGGNDRPIASLNASTTRTPASIIKVLTTYAAVLKLGFDYRWPTRFYRRGALKKGVLHGDLIVQGFGDPTLGSDDLEDIVFQIKAAGIRRITGSIVVDRSYFQTGDRNSAKFDENPYSPYNAMPDAMMFNERISTICVVPGRNSVTKKYPDRSYIVHNRLQRVSRPCRGRYAWPHVKVDDSKAVPEVWLKGKISKRCAKREICRVLTQPYKSLYYALKEALREAGIPVYGSMKLRKVPRDATILFTHYSEPLEKIVAKTAKKSNNLYARHLLLFLGAKVFGAPATVEKGRRAVIRILSAHNALDRGRVRIDNGSGLSRSAKLNAKSLAKMLESAYGRYGERWMKTLSVAGVDGTIKKRFRGTVVENRAWMKTGTLKHAKNIAGYVKSRTGRIYTVVIIVNTQKSRSKAAKLEDKIIEWVVEYGGKKDPVSEFGHNEIFFIQAGSFSHFPTERYLTKIKAYGFGYRIMNNHTGYKVLIGPFKGEEEARAMLSAVRREISKGAFLLKDESVQPIRF